MPKNLVSLGIGLSTLSLTVITSSLMSDTVEGHWQVTIKSSLLLRCSFLISIPLQIWAANTTQP